MIETIVVVFIISSAPIAATAISNRRHAKPNREGGLKHYKKAKLKRVGRNRWVTS